MRINVKVKRDDAKAPRDVPCYPSFPLKFVKKMIGAKVAMIFGR